MKRKIGVTIAVIVLVSIGTVFLSEGRCTAMEGTILEKGEKFIMIENMKGEKVTVGWSAKENYGAESLSVGDQICVYFNGNILERSPLKLEGVKKIIKK